MKKQHNYTIDVIRVIAAFLIMIFHFETCSPGGKLRFAGGYVFVELFFMITGYFTSLHMNNIDVQKIAGGSRS